MVTTGPWGGGEKRLHQPSSGPGMAVAGHQRPLPAPSGQSCLTRHGRPVRPLAPVSVAADGSGCRWSAVGRRSAQAPECTGWHSTLHTPAPAAQAHQCGRPLPCSTARPPPHVPPFPTSPPAPLPEFAPSSMPCPDSRLGDWVLGTRSGRGGGLGSQIPGCPYMAAPPWPLPQTSLLGARLGSHACEA